MPTFTENPNLIDLFNDSYHVLKWKYSNRRNLARSIDLFYENFSQIVKEELAYLILFTIFTIILRYFFQKFVFKVKLRMRLN